MSSTTNSKDMKQLMNMTPESSQTPMVATINDVPLERREKVLEIMNGIQITPSFTMSYASDASKTLMQNSDSILKEVRLKDNPEIEEMLTNLMGEIKKLDPKNANGNFLQRLFKVDTIGKFLQKYDSIESVIDDIVQNLEVAKFQLRKDATYCESQKDETLKYIRTLEEYIMAGELKIAEIEASVSSQKDSLSDDIIDVQIWSDENNELQNFKNKVRDLKFMRYVAGLSLAQLSMVQSGNNALANKLESSTGSMVTLWKQQMTAATFMARQQTAVALQQNVRATTNNLVKRTSEMLHAGSIEVAKELEASIVDVDTMVTATNNFLATITDVKKVRLEAVKKNQEGLRKLEDAQSKLNAMLLTSG